MSDESPQPAPCPPLETLETFIAQGEDDPGLRRHLDACAACRARVRRIRDDNTLLGEFVAANHTEFEPTPSTEVGVPGYELIEELHRGAQGVVFRALHRATKREVAVKLLLQGAFATVAQRRRFEREVELVAGLRHPGIVTIYDSGRTADGGHYLAMEFIEGRTLNEYLPAQCLPPRQPDRALVRRRIELFAEICAAVSAAHQRGIIHRDLKPDNILIDREHRPHVLDFGLAKRAQPGIDEDLQLATMAGEFLGTFAYAAPEQVKGDPHAVDVRSDVYALGVLLHEMLTGARPYDLVGSMAEVVETILSTRPHGPAHHNGAVNDEVDTIARTALAKDPERRYQSAGALLDDVRHYLRGEPINAKRDNGWYLLKKALWRHKIPATIAASFFALTLAFAVTMSVLYQRATDAEYRSSQMLGVFRQALNSDRLVHRPGADMLSEYFAELDRYIGDGELEAVDEATLRTDIGLAQLDRGKFPFALTQFDRVLQLRMKTYGDRDHPILADAWHNHGRALWWLGRYPDAEVSYRQGLDMRLRLFGRTSTAVADSLNHLAASIRRQGRYAEAEPRFQEVLELRRELLRAGSPDARSSLVAQALNNLGVCRRAQRRFDEALSDFSGAFEIISAAGTPSPRRFAQVHHNIATCLHGRGDAASAWPLLAEVIRIREGLWSDLHPELASSRLLLSEMLLDLGEIEHAETWCREVIRAERLAHPDEAHTDTAAALNLLGNILLRQDQIIEAEDVLMEAYRIRTEVLTRSNWERGETLSLLGECWGRAGRFDEASVRLTEAYGILQQLPRTDGVRISCEERLQALYTGASSRVDLVSDVDGVGSSSSR